MKRKAFIIWMFLLLCATFAVAQETEMSNLHKQAEAVDVKKEPVKARSLYVRAFNDYTTRGLLKPAVECATKATALYYKENLYQEAFDLVRHVDQIIEASHLNPSAKAALHYMTTKERMQMYIKMRRSPSAYEQLSKLEVFANQSSDEEVKNDLLYNKAIYYYTFGQNAQGNAVFKEMADKLTAQKEYDKVDEVYQTLIANGRKSGNASLVAQSYSNYIAWKDSANAQKVADEIGALKQQITAHEATIAEKDSSISTRQFIIIALCVLTAALAAALIIGTVILMRYIFLSRKQKKTIQLANESNALKAKFISNIAGQLEPTFRKLDSRQPEVQALLDFSSHIQTLSDLENSSADELEQENVQMQTYCEQMIEKIRDKVKKGVILTASAPKMSAQINKAYVSHIVEHLLNNAAEYTPEGGNITLEFKKRSPRTFQFLVSDTGQGIAEEKRDDVFKPFLEVRDLTKGDGLGLPICKQMALKMNGDLDIDSQYTKGARFVLELHSK